jgi:membrane protease YdiL (CAAX protease family)
MKRNKALMALLLLVPVPALGALSAMVFWPNTQQGATVFAVSKLWLFLLPFFWHKCIDKGSFSFSPLKNGGLFWGLLSGLSFASIVFLMYRFMGDRLIDFSDMKMKIGKVGLAKWETYVLAAAYWIFVNSVLEEYVWRWFVVRKCEDVFDNAFAIIAAGFFFTLHHIVAMSVYMGGVAVFLCSSAVFVAGCFWSFLYTKFRSIWPAYFSHAIVDLCIFLIGADIIFRR